MPDLTLAKYHALGNDFLVLLAGAHDDHGDLGDLDARALARAACDRRRGVGADGLIVATTGAGGEAEVAMLLHNADGSRAEMSGNGIRCLAQAVVDAGLLTGPDLRIRTDAGVRLVTVAPESEPGLRHVTVDMGPATVSVTEPGRADVDMGNPHLVLLTRDAATVDLLELGRRHPEVNVEVIAPAPEADSLVLRVHERGVGVTEACGTGSCAAAAAARLWGLVGDRVLVHNPGGDVTVDLRPDTVLLTGPTRYVARVELAWQSARPARRAAGVGAPGDGGTARWR